MYQNKKIFMLDEIPLKELSYDSPVKIGNFYRSNVNYEDKNYIIIQTPPLDLAEVDAHRIELRLNDKRCSKIVYNILRSIEGNTINYITEHMKPWFGRVASINQIRSQFRSILQTSVNDTDQSIKSEYFSTNFTLQLRRDKNLEVYNEEKEKLLPEDLIKGNNVECLIKLGGILFGRGGSKLDMKVCQIRVCKPPPQPPIEEKVTENVIIKEQEKKEEEEAYDSDLEHDEIFVPTENSENTENTENSKSFLDSVVNKQPLEQEELNDNSFKIKKIDHEPQEEPLNNKLKNMVNELVTLSESEIKDNRNQWIDVCDKIKGILA